MYQGLAIEPAAKKDDNAWDRYRWHVENIIANDNPELIQYIWAFLAHLFQRPGQKPGVALVLKGPRGAGKGCFVDPLSRILGYHYARVDNQAHVTGRFNAHLENKIVVFVDEAFWSGDKSAEGALKGMITEPTLIMERKGVDGFKITDHRRLIIASNEEWVVQAGRDERRFCVINVSNKKKQNHDYFRQIFKQMRNGGGRCPASISSRL
jgi:phage/plasmid-associated DNA primase